MYREGKKATRKLAILIVFALVFTTIFRYNDIVVKAAEEDDDEEQTSSTPANNNIWFYTKDADNDPYLEQKTLLQASNDWTIFQYINVYGVRTFDVRYQGKTERELYNEGYQLQYRVVFKRDSSMQFAMLKWCNIYNKQKADLAVYDSPQYYFIQFRVTDKTKAFYENNADVYEEELESYQPVLEDSISSMFPLYYEEAPYILDSSAYNYVSYYDLRTNPNEFTVSLTFSEPMEQVSDLSVTPSTEIDENLHEYSATNLNFTNTISENTINGKVYKIENSTVTFDVELSPTTISRQSISYYTFKLNGIKGKYSGNEPANLTIDVLTPLGNTNPDDNNVSVDSIKITSSSTNVTAGDSIQLAATVTPTNATNKTVTWESSNTSYATVDSNGNVTTYAAGAGKSVTITATSNADANVSDSYTLSIIANQQPQKQSPDAQPQTPQDQSQQSQSQTSQPGSTLAIVNVTKITAASNSIAIGKKLQLKAELNPSSATNAIKWKSSNTKYATVDSNGVVTAKKAGAGKNVTIAATAVDGNGTSATLELKITSPVTKIKIKASSKTVKAGKKVMLTTIIAPTDATNKKVAWSSSNKKYATVSSKGVVKTKKAGAGKTVIITAKAKDGSGKKATVKIKIKK